MADRDELKRKQRLLMLKQKQQGISPQEGLDALNTIRGGAQALTQGTTLGFGDEIAAGARALLDPLIGLASGEDVSDYSFGDSYDMYRGDERQNIEQFGEENPVASTALEIGGAIASPVNAIKAPAMLANAMRGRPLANALGRATAEGAAYGAGTAEEGDRIEGALKGGATSLGTTGLLKSLGAAAQPLYKRRVAEELGKGDEFVPLNLSSEGYLGDFYRDYVGRAYRGSEKLRQQSAPIMGKVTRVLERVKDKGKALKNTLAREKEALTSRGQTNLDVAEGPLKKAAAQAKQQAKGIDPKAARVVDEQFNLDTLRKAAPEGYADTITEVGEAGAKQLDDAVNRAYADAWTDVAPSTGLVTGLRGGLKEAQKALSKKDARILAGLSDALDKPGLNLKTLDDILRQAKKTNWKRTDVRGVIDSARAALRNEVPDQGLLAAADEAYPKFLTARNASAAADETGGVFTPKQIATSSRAVGGKPAAAVGEGPLQQQGRQRLQQDISQEAAAKAEKARLDRQAVKLSEAAGEAKTAAASQNKVQQRTQERAARRRTAEQADRLEKAESGVKTVKSLSPPDPEDISGLSAALTTKAFSPFRSAFQGVNLATGGVLAEAAASPTVQRALAGQTAPQTAIAKALRDYEEIIGLTRKGISRYAGG